MTTIEIAERRIDRAQSKYDNLVHEAELALSELEEAKIDFEIMETKIENA